MSKIISAFLATTIAATSLVGFSGAASAYDRHGRHERNWDNGHGRHHDNDNDGAAIAAGVVGLIIGAAIASSAQPTATAYAPSYSGGYDGYDRYEGYSDYDRACAAKYWSYQPESGTYLAANGYRYQCQL